MEIKFYGLVFFVAKTNSMKMRPDKISEAKLTNVEK